MNKEYNLSSEFCKTIYIQRNLGRRIDEETKKVMDRIRIIKQYAEDVKKRNLKKMELLDANKYSVQYESVKFPSDIDTTEYSLLNVPPVGTIQNISNGLWTIQGMRIEHVTLLREIGINSIYDLSKENPDALYLEILKRGRAHEKGRDWIPTKGMIIRWIRVACTLTNMRSSFDTKN